MGDVFSVVSRTPKGAATIRTVIAADAADAAKTHQRHYPGDEIITCVIVDDMGVVG